MSINWKEVSKNKRIFELYGSKEIETEIFRTLHKEKEIVDEYLDYLTKNGQDIITRNTLYEIAHYLKSKGKYHDYGNILWFMHSRNNTHPFIMSLESIQALNPEYTKPNYDKKRLPYNNMLFLNNFTFKNITLGPMCLSEVKKHTDEGIEIIIDYIVMCDNKYSYDGTIYDKDTETNLDNEDKKIVQFIKGFIHNLIDFINNPEITFSDKTYCEQRNAKRIKRGKYPLPNHTYISITGELKNSIERFNAWSSSLTRKHWVRGHFRTLRDEERFGDNVGKKIWIEPFVRGEGILLKHTYIVGGAK